MLWLDTVLTVPTMGFRLDPWHGSQDQLFKCVKDVVAKWSKEGVKVELESSAPGHLVVKAANGYAVIFDVDNIVVQFGYSGTIRDQPGGLAVLEFASEVRPYSDLLDNIMDAAADILVASQQSRPGKLHRFGMVANARVDASNPPPGIETFLHHLASPWDEGANRFDVSITARLPGDDEEGRVMCHHKLESKGEEGSDDLRVLLDWQLYFAEPRAIPRGKGKCIGMMKPWRERAVAYFTAFGEGDLNYADSDGG